MTVSRLVAGNAPICTKVLSPCKRGLAVTGGFSALLLFSDFVYIGLASFGSRQVEGLAGVSRDSSPNHSCSGWPASSGNEGAQRRPIAQDLNQHLSFYPQEARLHGAFSSCLPMHMAHLLELRVPSALLLRLSSFAPLDAQSWPAIFFVKILDEMTPNELNVLLLSRSVVSALHAYARLSGTLSQAYATSGPRPSTPYDPKTDRFAFELDAEGPLVRKPRAPMRTHTSAQELFYLLHLRSCAQSASGSNTTGGNAASSLDRDVHSTCGWALLGLFRLRFVVFPHHLCCQ